MCRPHYRIIMLLRCWLSASLFLLPLSATQPHWVYAQSAERGQISGLVTNTEHEPIEGVAVRAYTDADRDGIWQPSELSTYTDRNGVYTLCCLLPGDYRVGFADYRYHPKYYDNVTTLEAATTIPVRANQTTADINVGLVHKGRIRGYVGDLHGDPLKGIYVYVYQDVDGDNHWAEMTSVQTDRTGLYLVEGLDRGFYRVAFRAYRSILVDEFYDNAATLETADNIYVNSTATVAGINAQLAGPTGRILGTVTDEADQLLAGVFVTALRDEDQDGNWLEVAYDETAVDGTYLLSTLPDGDYRVRFVDAIFQYKRCPQLRNATQYFDRVSTPGAATVVTITQGRTRTQINGRLEPTSHLQGRVTDLHGNPASVSVIALGGPDATLCFSSHTNGDGTFAIGVSPAAYRLYYYAGFKVIPDVVYTSEYYDNVASLDAATFIVVAPGATVANLDAQLAPPGTIRGRVRNLQGQGLAQIRVTAYRDRSGNGNWQLVSTTETDTAGAYGLPGVGGYDAASQPFAYRIKAEDLRTPPLYHMIVYPDVGYLDQGRNVTVARLIEVTGVDLQLVAQDAINFAPLAHADQRLTEWDSEAQLWRGRGSVLTNDLDAEASPLVAMLGTAPDTGLLRLDPDGTFTFVPTTTPWSSATFSYVASDGVAVSTPVSATLFPMTDQRFLPLINR